MRKTASLAILSALFLTAGMTNLAHASALPRILQTDSPRLSAISLDNKQQTASDKTLARAKQPVNNPSPAPAAPDKTVTVQSGDTLIGLASTNQTTYQRLFDANAAIADPDMINPGQQLTVPTDSEQLPDRMATLPQATQQSIASAAASYTPAQTAAVSYPAVTGNDAKAFIYSHESGNNPNATSPNGCYGLGQDCNGRVRSQCGADYACQDAYFTNYATSRYGSWDEAAAFWQTHGWW